MNGSAAKAARRDLRRTVGGEAIEIIDAHTQALNNQVLPNLNALTEVKVAHDQRLNALLLTSQLHDRRLLQLETRPHPQTFWARLSWLVRG